MHPGGQKGVSAISLLRLKVKITSLSDPAESLRNIIRQIKKILDFNFREQRELIKDNKYLK